MRFAAVVAFILVSSPAFAQPTAPFDSVSPVRGADLAQGKPPHDQIDLFGLKVTQNERFKFGGELVAGWSHDGAQAALGLEKQGRIGMAILSVSGKISNRVRYFMSVNPVNETKARPACG